VEEFWLVCGTQQKTCYRNKVFKVLDEKLSHRRACSPRGSGPWKPAAIVEGCCPDSADVYAEEWAKENDIPILHYPATSGTYLRRNIEMVEKCTSVFAFFDGFSYGTAHTIAWANIKRKPAHIYLLKEVK
jgi:hypothetical protein